jgi:hypothetical protein
MKSKLWIFIISFIALNATMGFGVEFLVKAQANWMEDVPQEEKDKWTEKQIEKYERRTIIGDIIVVKPNNWKWGKEECLPRFIILKISDMREEEAIKYIEPLTEITGIIEKKLKRRKYHIPATRVEEAKILGGIMNLTKSVFIGEVTEKEKTIGKKKPK